MTEYYTEGGFHFSVEKGLINISSELGGGGATKVNDNGVVLVDDDEEEEQEEKGLVMESGDYDDDDDDSDDDDDEDEEVIVDDVADESFDDGSEEELSINDVILVGDDDWSNCGQQQYDSAEEEEQIWRKYATSSGGTTKIESADSAPPATIINLGAKIEPTSSRSILKPRPSVAAARAQSEHQYSKRMTEDSPKDSALRQWLVAPPVNASSLPPRPALMPPKRPADVPAPRIGLFHLRDRSNIKRRKRVDEEEREEQRGRRPVPRGRPKKVLPPIIAEESRVRPTTAVQQPDNNRIINSSSSSSSSSSRHYDARSRSTRSRVRDSTMRGSSSTRQDQHNIVEKERRKELKQLFENLHELLVLAARGETDASLLSPSYSQLQLAQQHCRIAPKVQIITNAVVVIKSLEQTGETLEARRNVLRKLNAGLSKKVRQLEMELRPPTVHDSVIVLDVDGEEEEWEGETTTGGGDRRGEGGKVWRGRGASGRWVNQYGSGRSKQRRKKKKRW